jgi:transposase
MAEFGIVAPIGRRKARRAVGVLSDLGDERVPALARDCLVAVAEQLMLVKAKILDMDRRIMACHRSSDMSRRLAESRHWPAASALVARYPTSLCFGAPTLRLDRAGAQAELERRQGAARRHHQTGQQIPRSMLTVRALAVIRYAERHGTKRPWIIKLLARRPTKVAAVALPTRWRGWPGRSWPRANDIANRSLLRHDDTLPAVTVFHRLGGATRR